jgi:hypothetical protein
MDTIFKRFIKKIFIFTLIITAISFAVFYFIKPEYYFRFYPGLPSLFITVSILIHRILLKSAFDNPRRFTNAFMLTLMSKMFFYLTLSAIYLYANPQNAKVFILCVLILYVSYSTYEIYLLLKDLKAIDEIRKKNKNNS